MDTLPPTSPQSSTRRARRRPSAQQFLRLREWTVRDRRLPPARSRSADLFPRVWCAIDQATRRVRVFGVLVTQRLPLVVRHLGSHRLPPDDCARIAFARSSKGRTPGRRRCGDFRVTIIIELGAARPACDNCHWISVRLSPVGRPPAVPHSETCSRQISSSFAERRSTSRSGPSRRRSATR